MAYTKQTWQDLPNKTTPINAARLGHIEDGIFNAAQVADSATTALGNKVDKVPGQGLSTNDYSDADEAIVAAVPAALATKQPKTLDTPITIGGESRTTVEAALGALEDSKEDTILAATPLVKEYDEIMRQEVLRLTMDDTPTASSNNPVKSGGVKSAVTATVDLMKDTTGWTGKNKLKNTASSSTINSIPFVRNSDETWEVGTGTASADVWNNISGVFRLPEGKYRLSGCPEGGSGNTYFLYLRNNPLSEGDISVSEAGNGVEFTVTSELAQKDLVLFIAVKNGATISNPVIFKPMICTVEQYDLSPTYEPYHESVEDWYWDNNAKLGAHQLIPLTIEHFKIRNTTGVWDNNAYTVNDVTLTFEETNGYVTKIIVNGTPSANTWFGLYLWGVNTFDKGDYELLGCPEGGSGSNYQVLFRENPQVSGGLSVNNYGSPVPFSISNSAKEYMAFIGLGVGVTFTNKIFTPLIRYAGDTNSECTPFAMTNGQLTEKVFKKTSLGSNDDLNNVTTTGLYDILAQPNNCPTSYGTLLVNERSDGGLTHIIFKSNEIYTRGYGGSPAAWSAWTKFTGTVVS